MCFTELFPANSSCWDEVSETSPKFSAWNQGGVSQGCSYVQILQTLHRKTAYVKHISVGKFWMCFTILFPTSNLCWDDALQGLVKHLLIKLNS